jgi:hypothetical protein
MYIIWANCGFFTSAGIWNIGDGLNDFLIFQNVPEKYLKDNTE